MPSGSGLIGIGTAAASFGLGLRLNRARWLDWDGSGCWRVASATWKRIPMRWPRSSMPSPHWPLWGTRFGIVGIEGTT